MVSSFTIISFVRQFSYRVVPDLVRYDSIIAIAYVFEDVRICWALCLGRRKILPLRFFLDLSASVVGPRIWWRLSRSSSQAQITWVDSVTCFVCSDHRRRNNPYSLVAFGHAAESRRPEAEFSGPALRSKTYTHWFGRRSPIPWPFPVTLFGWRTSGEEIMLFWLFTELSSDTAAKRLPLWHSNFVMQEVEGAKGNKLPPSRVGNLLLHEDPHY